jgi:hypothetical protein
LDIWSSRGPRRNCGKTHEFGMFAPLLKLVPALRWNMVSTPDQGRERMAIDACISAVRISFPCEMTAPMDYACLCEQYTWQIA